MIKLTDNTNEERTVSDMKQKIYENKKISGIIFVVLLWFVLSPMLPLNIRVIKEVSGVFVGMNSVTLLFCVLLMKKVNFIYNYSLILI